MTETDKKEIKNFIKDQTADFKRHVGALSEHFQQQTSGVAENFLDLKKDIGKINKTLESHTEMIGEIKVNMEVMKEDIETIKGDIVVMKKDIGEVKTDLKQKADTKDLKVIGHRVAILETHRGFAPTLAIILAVIVIGGGAYLYQNNQKKVEGPMTITGWQTYKNDKYGFEFKYPNDWQFEKLEKLGTAFGVGVFDPKVLGSIFSVGVFPKDIKCPSDVLENKYVCFDREADKLIIDRVARGQSIENIHVSIISTFKFTK